MTRHYIEWQKEHHQRLSFKDEYLKFLREYRVDWDENYLWKSIYCRFFSHQEKLTLRQIQTTQSDVEIKKIKVIRIHSLLAVTIDNYLCTFYIEGEENFICTKQLNEVEKILPDYFIRIRRNTIIHTQKIKSVNTRERKISLYGGVAFQYAEQNAKTIKRFVRFSASL